MLPPGDIRNCLLALANIEPTMDEVMKYRFTEGGLKGQSFGNLFLAAMNGLYGNFEVAVYKMSRNICNNWKGITSNIRRYKSCSKAKR